MESVVSALGLFCMLELDNMGLETWKHLRAKLMLWPFHLRCKTMDFLDIQEMLVVIFNVSFKLNYIPYIQCGSVSTCPA